MGETNKDAAPIPTLAEWLMAIQSADGPSHPSTRHALVSLGSVFASKGLSDAPSVSVCARDLVQISAMSLPTIGKYLRLAVIQGWLHRKRSSGQNRGSTIYLYTAQIPGPMRRLRGLSVNKKQAFHVERRDAE